jgi:hypothetical protein
MTQGRRIIRDWRPRRDKESVDPGAMEANPGTEHHRFAGRLHGPVSIWNLCGSEEKMFDRAVDVTGIS